MLISVIVPALNEERYLPKTLTLLADAMRECPHPVELIVVDNDSADTTARVAERFGATIVRETVHNVARVRNAGASIARGDILVFLDADTEVPCNFLARVSQAVADPNVLGGTADVVHSPRSAVVRLYLACWRLVGKLFGMAQGAAQFCRRPIFERLGGYDESLFMGEDVDFYWRLKSVSAKVGARVEFLADVQVYPSARRFDQRPLWRTLIWTNPLFTAVFRKTPEAWRDWYVRPPR
jgi:glycosyltransferase involved in cell wall biosynthesis